MNYQEDIFKKIFQESGIKQLDPTIRKNIIKEISKHQLIQVGEPSVSFPWLPVIGFSILVIFTIAITWIQLPDSSINYYLNKFELKNKVDIYIILSALMLPAITRVFLYSKKLNRWLNPEVFIP